MSGAIKAIGKVFKAVWKVVKVVAPIVLGVAAVIFTAGAAIPALAGTVLAGGFGGAAAGLTASLGLSGTLGAAVTGAITYAGYGAATGALTAAVTGGDPLKGAQTGALTGAVTGGLGAATGVLPAAQPTWGSGAPLPEVTVTPAQMGTPSAPVDSAGALANAANASATPAATAPAAAPGAAAVTPAQGGPLGGGILGKGGWVERNPQLASSLLQGVGNMFTPTRGEEDRKLFEKMGANYAGGGGLLQAPDVAMPTGLRKPADAFSAARPVPTASQGAAYGFEWQWDPSQGRIVKVPRTG